MFVIVAWCLKNETVHCVLLGASSVEQLYENMQALQVSMDGQGKRDHMVFRVKGTIWLSG